MLDHVILWSLRNRIVVLLLACLLIIFGIRAAINAPLDVFPDFAPPQVVIQTEAPGFSSVEVEQQVTLPLENSLNGTSRLANIRSSSSTGLSVITCTFEDDIEIFRARQLVTEKLNLVSAHLPPGVEEPQISPISPPVGIILKISLTSSSVSPMEMRSIADWTIRPRLLGVRGVSQVTIFGGEVKQYQVLVRPDRLSEYGLSLSDVRAAAAGANENSAAGFLQTGSQTLPIQGEGRVRTLDDLAGAVIAVRNSQPIRLRDLADVRLGPEFKVGDASTEGRPSVNLIILKQPWASTLTVTEEVESALDELQAALPSGVQLNRDIFRQADFIERSIRNIQDAMLQGGALVVLVLAIFLFSWRTGLISLTAIPLSLLAAVLVLLHTGATINTMTLGGLAIAVGEVVDDAIIDVENVLRRLRENRLKGDPAPLLSVIYHASKEVRGSMVYATFIVALVFLPVFSLSGLAGRIFAPLGFAYVIAIMASLLVAVTVTPALCYFLLPRIASTSHDTITVRTLKRGYARLLDPVLNRTGIVMLCACVLLAGALLATQFLGGEFLPEFNEGNLIIHMTGLPGTSLQESIRVGAVAQKKLHEVPEVVKTAQQAGRAELGEDPLGPNFSEVDVRLRETDRRRDAVLDDVRARLVDIPGFTFGVKQFISERIEEVLSGTTATIAIKVFGPDLEVLRRKAIEIRSAAARVDGIEDLNLPSQSLMPTVRLIFDREAMANHGLSSADIAAAARTAFYGDQISQVFEQQRAFDIVFRLHPEAGRDLATMGQLLIDTPLGGKVPLESVARLVMDQAPGVIDRENAQRSLAVTCNVSEGSLAEVVRKLRHAVSREVKLPPGYFVVYGGQYEAQSQAYRQISILSIAAVAGIFMLLCLAFRSVGQSLLVMANLPLALIGGVAAVLLANAGHTSVASLVGFVSLFGIATRNGIMLVTHYNHLVRNEGMPFGRELIVRGALERLSPILMTAMTAGLALLPLAIAVGRPGRELEQPMAVVILGGLVTSTLLNLLVLPALYLRFGRRLLLSGKTEAAPEDRSASVEGGL